MPPAPNMARSKGDVMPALLPALLLLAAAADPMPQAPAAPATDCAAAPAALPPALAGWPAPSPLAAARNGDASAAVLTIGQAADLTLSPTPRVDYPVRPERPGGSVSYGGIVRFSVARAGVYRVALDSGVWIDVIADGARLESVAHGHGPDCSGIRKMVDFRLEPGTYLLEIAGSGAPSLRVMIAAVPEA